MKNHTDALNVIRFLCAKVALSQGAILAKQKRIILKVIWEDIK